MQQIHYSIYIFNTNTKAGYVRFLNSLRKIYKPFYETNNSMADYGGKGTCMEEKRQINAQLIGQNIRRIRLEHGETQQQLGTLLRYGATTIANYETGYRMPDLETFFQIALHYGASLDLETFFQIALHYGASLEDFIREQETAIPDESQNGFI